MVQCPICNANVNEVLINSHIDSGCTIHIHPEANPNLQAHSSALSKAQPLASIFNRVKPSHAPETSIESSSERSTPKDGASSHPLSSDPSQVAPQGSSPVALLPSTTASLKRSQAERDASTTNPNTSENSLSKKTKTSQPLAERARPKVLDDVFGQELVGPAGILRGMIEDGNIPSMILWGASGSGKTTIARLIAKSGHCRFVEINSTSSGVAECKKIFSEARSDFSLTSRKTILFCDEIHRFSKSQQDVFLGPVEDGTVTLIGSTTENPSFKVIAALLSRCRVFTLSKLSEEDIVAVLRRALKMEFDAKMSQNPLLDDEMIQYLAAFADGDARSALNLLEIAINIAKRQGATKDDLKHSLTRTLVYDRNGDQHYDTISAFHKSIRGSHADGALYYLARMIQSGEDPLYIARRMIVIASEDIGLADSSMLPLATACYTAVEKVGMPEARINLAHTACALSLAKKSTRAYRGFGKVVTAMNEPGVAGLPIPLHLRNAPTKLMRDLGYGKEYKYNPDYLDGRVAQQYLPDALNRRSFLDDRDLGDRLDEDLHG